MINLSSAELAQRAVKVKSISAYNLIFSIVFFSHSVYSMFVLPTVMITIVISKIFSLPEQIMLEISYFGRMSAYCHLLSSGGGAGGHLGS